MTSSTPSSTTVAAGQGLPMIGKLLGQTQVQTTARYAHVAGDPVESAADSVASTLHRAMTIPAQHTKTSAAD